MNQWVRGLIAGVFVIVATGLVVTMIYACTTLFAPGGAGP